VLLRREGEFSRSQAAQGAGEDSTFLREHPFPENLHKTGSPGSERTEELLTSQSLGKTTSKGFAGMLS